MNVKGFCHKYVLGYSRLMEPQRQSDPQACETLAKQGNRKDENKRITPALCQSLLPIQDPI